MNKKETRPITIRIPENLYRALRVYSAEKTMSMQSIVEKALTQHLKHKLDIVVKDD